ncbi:MAG: hypothetical protein WCI73_04565, partial [Phycisphaerae bacterium]
IVTPYTAMLIIEDEKAHGVATENRSLRDMDQDRAANANAAGNREALRRGGQTGESAVSGSMNLSDYKSAKSLDSAKSAAEQTDVRKQMPAQGGAALSRSQGYATPAAPGGWVGAAGPGGGGGAKSDYGYKVVTNYAQQNRVIASKTFYLNASQWTDQALQNAAANTPRQRIVFASEAYFELLKQQPESAQYLALGNNVTFVLKNTIYEVVDEVK